MLRGRHGRFVMHLKKRNRQHLRPHGTWSATAGSKFGAVAGDSATLYPEALSNPCIGTLFQYPLSFLTTSSRMQSYYDPNQNEKFPGTSVPSLLTVPEHAHSNLRAELDQGELQGVPLELVTMFDPHSFHSSTTEGRDDELYGVSSRQGYARIAHDAW